MALKSSDFKDAEFEVMVDTGAELNVIKKGALSASLEIATSYRPVIRAIMGENQISFGIARVVLYKKPADCVVLGDEFPMKLKALLLLKYTIKGFFKGNGSCCPLLEESFDLARPFIYLLFIIYLLLIIYYLLLTYIILYNSYK